ncbi:MAG TPA: GMC family oxidoreductase [Solirubrobacteraceae bacterium]
MSRARRSIGPAGDVTSGAYDVIVVGGGSSGGVVAARMSEDAACRVLLVEAGPDLPDHPRGRGTMFSSGSMLGEYWSGIASPTAELDWGFESEPLSNGRRVQLMRGRLVGGSGMTNGCVFVQGRPEDFARWEGCGAVGWGWSDVKPFYDAVRREVPIMTYPRDRWLPFDHLLVAGALDLGFEYVEDLDAPSAWDGVTGPWPRNRRNEIRQSSNVAYLRPARERSNLVVQADALVDRLVLRGDRVTGIRWIDASGRCHFAEGDHIVLSAGAYGSAPILLRSGIGPAQELRLLGIEPRVDLPVGQGLMDHPATSLIVRLDPEHVMLGWPCFAAVVRGRGWWTLPVPLDEEEGVAALSLCMAIAEGPEGGYIRLRSADPNEPPEIFHGYERFLGAGGFDSAMADWQRLLETPAFRAAGVRDTRAKLTLRESALRGLGTGAHPVGGCAIASVVDERLSVHGIEGLTVADASVFPRNVTNNPNFTCFMIGERAAAFLRAAPGRQLTASEESAW